MPTLFKLMQAIQKAGIYLEVGSKPSPGVPYIKSAFFNIGLN